MTDLFKPFIWGRYSSQFSKAILNPHNGGVITQEEADLCGMRLARGSAGRFQDGNKIVIYLLVDEDDGLIADAKFQAFGDTMLIGVLQLLCGFVLRKSYPQAAHMTPELLDQSLKEKAKGEGLLPEMFAHTRLAISALMDAVESCQDIPYAADTAPPVPMNTIEGEPQYPQFLELSESEKKAVVEKVIEKDIRPYIELDEGGVEITAINGYELTITYQGACTSCYSATGATLSAIQSHLQAKVHQSISVIPDTSTLTFT